MVRRKTMGFDELALVSPRDKKVCSREKVIQRASGAVEVLRNAKIYSSLDQALDGTNVICGTGMPNDMYRKRAERKYHNPRDYFELLLEGNTAAMDYFGVSCERAVNVRLALIFGSERTGMEESEMDQCHVMLGIPTNPEFGSLNLAAAVQLIAYDWRVALGGSASYGP
mmetsp:Transcript_20259/g.41401  ORF Transcript_20259/g.41401 Transcript_20259/m.41401 type:complete len:169 (+) Transcript_20259:94-600(+)